MLANLLAMPVVSIWVMPMGLLGVLALPLGFDGLFWWLMGEGVGWMITVSLWIAALPGAVGHITAFGIGALLLGSAGLIVLCLLKSPLRFGGILLIAIAALWAMRTPQPDVMISADGNSVAVRGASGPAVDDPSRQRQRHLCLPRMACRRRRYAHAKRSDDSGRVFAATQPAARSALADGALVAIVAQHRGL